MAQQINKIRMERDSIIYATIAAAFQASKAHFAGVSLDFSCPTPEFFPTFFVFSSHDGQMPHEMRRKNIPGHAIACYAQGISHRRGAPLAEAEFYNICKEMRGFFESSDTVPNLFDYAAHLRRATDINEVFDVLAAGGLITCRMDDSYFNVVNILLPDKKLLLADPQSAKGMLHIPLSDFIREVELAWIWPGNL